MQTNNMNTKQKHNSWLVSLGVKPIPESWYLEKDSEIVKKNKHINAKESAKFGIKQIKISDDAKAKLMDDISEVIGLGILEPTPIYDKLLADGKLTQSDGRNIPFFSFYKYATIVRKELGVRVKSCSEIIIELFNDGVTDRDELARQAGCTSDHVKRVLRCNGLTKRRFYKQREVAA